MNAPYRKPPSTLHTLHIFYSRAKWYVAQDGHETYGPFDSRDDAAHAKATILRTQHLSEICDDT